MPAAKLRQPAAALLSVAMLVAAALAATPAPHARDDRLNIVVILTDDQSFDTLPSSPPSLPWLQSQIRDPNGHWLWFPNAFIQTPLCCPSRATILSGGTAGTRTSGRTTTDICSTSRRRIATWLHDAGYFTGLIGKYLNRYPFGRGPYVPPGWDRWVAKRNTAAITTYSNFGFVDQEVALQTRDSPATYATDLFADHAVDFLRTAPDDRPFFLYFATSAPHPPWTPPLRHAGAFAGVPYPVRRRASTSATSRTSPIGCRSCVRSTPSIEPCCWLTDDTRRRRSSASTTPLSGSWVSSKRKASWIGR